MSSTHTCQRANKCVTRDGQTLRPPCYRRHARAWGKKKIKLPSTHVKRSGFFFFFLHSIFRKGSDKSRLLDYDWLTIHGYKQNTNKTWRFSGGGTHLANHITGGGTCRFFLLVHFFICILFIQRLSRYEINILIYSQNICNIYLIN